MLKPLFPLFAVFIFAACSVSTLQLTPDRDIRVEYDGLAVEIKGEGVKKEYINFTPLEIFQEVIRTDSGNCLVYETTELDPAYVYNNATARTMELIFDAERVNAVYRFNNLHFLQAEMKNGAVFNLLVQQSGDQELVFAYGFGHTRFKALLEKVKKPDAKVLSPLREDVTVFEDAEAAVQSRWRAEMIFFAPLISPFSYGKIE